MAKSPAAETAPSVAEGKIGAGAVNTDAEAETTAAVEGHCGFIFALTLCGDYLCSGGGDSLVMVWDARGGGGGDDSNGSGGVQAWGGGLSAVTALAGHHGEVLALVADSEAALLLSGSADATVKVSLPPVCDCW